MFGPDPPPRRDAATTRVSAIAYRIAAGRLAAVRVTAELAISRAGRREVVRGRVWARLSVPGARVEALRVGGALVRHHTCHAVLRDGELVAAGDTVTAGVRDAEYNRLGPRRGADACWVQAGHAYFTLRLDTGETWTGFVTTDARADLRPPRDTRPLTPPQ